LARQADIIGELLVAAHPHQIAAVEVPYQSYDDIDTLEDLSRIRQEILEA
jgi:hypothetical protein